MIDTSPIYIPAQRLRGKIIHLSPGGGYIAEQELAPGVAYIVLGVGKLGVGKLPAGIRVVTTEASAHA